jgi:predicted RNA-binding Zn ribbon-like protein
MNGDPETHAHPAGAAEDAPPGALRFVEAFVNSDDDDGTDEYATDASTVRWLVRSGLLEAGATVSEEERQTAVALRAALRALLLANHERTPPDQPAARAVLDDIAAAAGLELHFDGPSSASLHATAPGAAGAFGTVVAAVYDAMASGTWSRMKACRNDECQWAFYDHSRNRSGAWCAMSICGNRTKTRVYRRRRQA